MTIISNESAFSLIDLQGLSTLKSENQHVNTTSNKQEIEIKHTVPNISLNKSKILYIIYSVQQRHGAFPQHINPKDSVTNQQGFLDL